MQNLWNNSYNGKDVTFFTGLLNHIYKKYNLSTYISIVILIDYNIFLYFHAFN